LFDALSKTNKSSAPSRFKSIELYCGAINPPEKGWASVVSSSTKETEFSNV